MKLSVKNLIILVVVASVVLALSLSAAACSKKTSVGSCELSINGELLSWTGIENAYYFVKVAYDDKNGFEIPVYSATEYKINLTKAGSYRFWVRAYTEEGFGPYSNEVVFVLQKDVTTSTNDDKTVTYRGTGAKDDPILISSATELLSITTGTRSTVENDITVASKLYYLQTEDIDLGGAEVKPFATGSSRFSGYYDGGNHSVFNFVQNKTYGNVAYTYMGLFGSLKEAVIINLTIKQYSANVSFVENGFSWGAIAGFSESGTIENCYVDADININSPQQTEYLGYVGLLLGESKGTIIKRCHTSGKLSVSFSRAYAGGIVGLTKLTKNEVISECYSTAQVTAHGAGRKGATNVAIAYAGGIIGYASRFETIEDCWYSGKLAATLSDGGNPDNCGTGFFGGGNCRSADGLSYLTYKDCYFDYQKLDLALSNEYPTTDALANRYAVGALTKKQASSTTVYAFATNELASADSFAGLDFDNCWQISSNGPVIRPYTAVFPQ